MSAVVTRTAAWLSAAEARIVAARPDPARVVVTNGCPSIGIVEAAFVIAAFDDALVLVAEVKRLRALVGEASE